MRSSLIVNHALALALALGGAGFFLVAPESAAQTSVSAGEFTISLPIVANSAIVGDEAARAGRRLTFTSAMTWQPALSPDARYLVYVADVTDEVLRPEIHFVSLNTDPPIDMPIPLDKTFIDVDLPTFTSDGGEIIFSGHVEDQGWDVWRLDVSALEPTDTGTPMPIGIGPIAPGPLLRNLTASPEVDEHRPGLSPDGSLLVYDALVDGNEDLWLLDIAAMTKTRMTSHPAQDVLGSFSPDGRRIVFRSTRTGRSQILVIGVDGTRLARLTMYDSDDSYPSFTGDDRVVFQSNRGGSEGVYRMAANGRDPRPLLSGLARYLTPRVAPDGSTIVFSSDVADPKSGVLDIYMLSLE